MTSGICKEYVYTPELPSEQTIGGGQLVTVRDISGRDAHVSGFSAAAEEILSQRVELVSSPCGKRDAITGTGGEQRYRPTDPAASACDPHDRFLYRHEGTFVKRCCR